MFLFAAITLLVAPIVTVGMMVDVRRQKRPGGLLPPSPVTNRSLPAGSDRSGPAAGAAGS